MLDEYHYQRLFKKYAPVLIPGCEVVSVPSDKHNIPDAWIELDGENCPVEVKCLNFDAKALSQLQRYLDAYGAKRGVAVATNLKVDLPQNIIFISMAELMTIHNLNEKTQRFIEQVPLEEEMLGVFKSLSTDMQCSVIRIAKHMFELRDKIQCRV